MFKKYDVKRIDVWYKVENDEGVVNIKGEFNPTNNTFKFIDYIDQLLRDQKLKDLKNFGKALVKMIEVIERDPRSVVVSEEE